VSSSGGVDYTAERRKTERKNVSPLHHRRPTTEERRSIKRNVNNIFLGGGGGIYNKYKLFMKYAATMNE
jgi:hypothetical protein